MAYKFIIGGLEVTCDTLAELTAAIRGPEVAPKPVETVAQVAKVAKVEAPEPSAKGTQGRGPRMAWAEAEAYAEKHGLSKFEARAILKAKKTAAVNAAMKSLSESS